MARTAVLLSYRLGGTDGVSVEAGKWEWALRTLGFTTRRVAGQLCDEPRPEDVALPGIAIHAPDGAADARQVATALEGADLVVAENICSLPINARASYAASDALAHHPGRVVFHHHDLPWQRAELASIRGLPPDLPGALHVVVNDRSREELAPRGITAHTIHNTFDFDAPTVHRYPVLDEILAGVRVFSVDDPGEVAAWLRAPEHALLEANREVARRDFSLADLPGRLDAVFATNGWTSW